VFVGFLGFLCQVMQREDVGLLLRGLLMWEQKHSASVNHASSVQLMACFSRHWNMMAKFLGKQKPLEKVNLADKLSELWLDRYFGSESWPELASVRELKSKIRSAAGDGYGNPFVFADLRKCVCCVFRMA
jgi:hypothetical protein